MSIIHLTSTVSQGTWDKAISIEMRVLRLREVVVGIWLSQSDTEGSVSPSVVLNVVGPRGPHGAHQAPLSMGFSRQGYGSGLPFPSPGDLPQPGIELGSSAQQADSLPTELPGKPIFLTPYMLFPCTSLFSH